MSKMEVLKVMAHLLITLAIIVGYIVLIFVKGDHDTTLQGALFAIIGYWFGAINLNKGSNSNDNKGV